MDSQLNGHALYSTIQYDVNVYYRISAIIHYCDSSNTLVGVNICSSYRFHTYMTMIHNSCV